MTKRIQMVLFLSIILTILCPIFGILPLWFSLKTFTTKDNVQEVAILTTKATKWLKICAIAMVVTYIAVVGFMIYLMQQ